MDNVRSNKKKKWLKYVYLCAEILKDFFINIFIN